MFYQSRFVLTLLLVGLSGVSIMAQEAACPDLVQTALAYIDTQCSGIERNQACYGNLQVEAVPQPDATDFKFDTPGDIENIASIASLNLSEMVAPDTWGVSLLSVQANLPDSVPGQNVTMLLFGDVTIENQQGIVKPVTQDVSVSQNARVRSGPGTANGQIGTLKTGDVVIADGRNEAGDWLRIQLADGTSGWVSVALLKIDSDLSQLGVVEGSEIGGVPYGPMQAFYFTSGIGSADCAEAPQDGILIQTPEGAGKIDLLINEVQISVGSTIYLTAQAGQMAAAVLHGRIMVTAAGTTILVPEGAQAVIPLDENGLANGAPVLQGYEDTTVAPLTAVVHVLPQPVEVAAGRAGEDFTTPRSGEWTITWTAYGGCAHSGGPGVAFNETLTFEDGLMREELSGQVYAQTEPNTYVWSDGVYNSTATFTSAFTGIWTGSGGGCVPVTQTMLYLGE